MKKVCLITLYLLFAIFASCNSTAADGTSKKYKSLAKNESSKPVNEAAPVDGDGVVGDWKLILETYDNNHNKALDDDERKKGFSNHYFYRFGSDGSCLISPFANNQLRSAFKGHYKITEKNGRKIITTFWDEAEQKGQQEAQYTIVSLNKEELVLLETTGDHTFWIFKKVG